MDVSDLAGKGLFNVWADRTVFEGVHIDNGAIAWPGNLDLCPDALCLRLTGKAAEELIGSPKPASVDA